MRRHVLVGALVLLFWPNAHAMAADQAKKVSFCELTGNSKLHSRQLVRVRAVFAQGAEQSVLYANECGPARPRWLLSSTHIPGEPQKSWIGQSLKAGGRGLLSKAYSTAPSQPRWTLSFLTGSS